MQHHFCRGIKSLFVKLSKLFVFNCLVALLFAIPATSLAQAAKAKVAGKILNSKNEPLPGVSIKVKDAPGGVQSDVDGNFVISLDAGKKFTLTFSFVGYADKTVDVEPKTNELTQLDVVLETKTSTGLGDVVVKGTARTARMETVNSAIQYTRNTNTVAAVLSAETIRRSPDKNTGEALKRIPGTSIQEGKYLIVRGLADRYNQAMLNGILLSSTEPDRKTFSFDIFPAGMVENIIINKAFVPELPGEWAGGLVQVNTKDIPAANFLTIQLGTGFNTQTIGKDFYTYNGGKHDWLGFEDGTRSMPNGIPTRSQFQYLSAEQKTEWGKKFDNTWDVRKVSAPLNASFQLSGGLNTKIFGKKLGIVTALTYNKTNRNLAYENKFFNVTNNQADVSFNYFNNKYSQDVLWGALGNITLQLNNRNKISFKNIININASDYTTLRTGIDKEQEAAYGGQNIRAKELAFRSNVYFNTQLTGEHSIGGASDLKLKWFGGFNILDQYIPDQRRIQYNQSVITPGQPYYLLIADNLSQKSGSRFFSTLNDYIYTAGGDLTKSFNLFNSKQTIKGGYMLQIKDRLFDARPFAVYLPLFNDAVKQLPESQVFAASNFGTGAGKFSFDEINDSRFRYMANSILNAGFLQLDNQFGSKWRLVWGARIEHFDQVIGSLKKSDPRHVYNKKMDVLPGLNLTYKATPKTNIRFSASQTVIRPEFRELSTFAFFDFELGATVQGRSDLQRTKITNVDLRYELYPNAGELFTVGLFYKYFKNPIEVYFNQTGVGTSSTFNFLNAEQAASYGVELEVRKKLDFSSALKNFTVTGNLSYIKSDVNDSRSNIDRPMQGQSPYVINLGLQYDVEKAGLTTTLLFNQIGRRIAYVGNDQTPAIWENPRPLLDFQIAKKVLAKKGEIRLNVQDLLNKRAYFYHDLDTNSKLGKSTDAIAINRNYGTTISLTFGYAIK